MAENKGPLDDLFPPAAAAPGPLDDLFPPASAAPGPLDDLFPPASAAPRTSVPAAEEDDEGVVESVGRGIVTAPISLAQGLVELGAIGLDSAFDTNTLRPVSDWFDEVKEGIEPTGNAGKIAEEVVGFGLGFIPIAGWLGRASHVAKGGRAVASSKFMKSAEQFGKTAAAKKLLTSRAGLFGTTAAATGAYEGIFSPDGRETLSDSVGVLPEALKTEAYTGQSGRSEAGRQLRNKMRQAAEASAMSAGFDTLLYGLGAGSREVAKLPVINETLSAGGRGVVNAFDLVGRGVAKVPGAQQAKEGFDKYFSSTRGADPTVVANIQDVEGLTKAQKNRAVKLITGYENTMKGALKEIKRQNGSRLSMEEAEKDIYNYLVGGLSDDAITSRYGPAVLRDVSKLVQQSTDLEDILVRQLEDVASKEELRLAGATAQVPFAPGVSVTGRGTAAREALNQIKALQQNRRAHLSRMFEVHQNPLKFYQELDENFMEQKPFQQAVEDLMRYNTRKNPQAFGSPENRANAERLILDIVGLGEIKPGVDPKAQINNRLSQIKRELGQTGGLANERQSLFRLADEMLISRKQLITEVPAVRAFMGEVTDPKALAINTLNNLAETTTAFDFYRNVVNPNTVGAGSALSRIREGARPLAIEVPNPAQMTPDEYASEVELLRQGGLTVDNLEDTLDLYGYKKLGEANPDSALGGRFGDLSGKFVPAEVYDNLTAPVTLTAHPVSQLASIVNQIKGLSQKQLIVPNVASRVRDFLGNQLMRVATGNAPSMYNQDYMGAAQVFLRGASNLNDEGLENLKFKLDAAGVTDSNILLNAIKQYQEEGSAVGAAQKTRKVIEKYEGLPVMKQVMSFFENVTDGVDGYSKATVLMGEEAKLNEMFKGASLNNPDDLGSALNWMQRNNLATRTRSEVLDFAAEEGRPSARLSPVEIIASDRTKAMMPTYSQIGTAVRALDRALPFGNFTSFASENIRNMSNILNLGLKELASAVDDDLIAEIGEERARALVRQTRAVGAQRLTGLLTVAAITPKAMVRASMNATGTTEEQMDRLHEEAADYLDGHDLVILDNDGEGKYQYVDLSYVAPYSFVTDAVQAGLRAYSERGRLDKSEADQLASGAWSSVSSLADPFASESIVFERIRDALPSEGFPGIGRGGVTSTGAKIYRDTDDYGTKVARGFFHVMDSLAPAYVKLAGEGKKGDIEPGRLTRAMMNTPGARGQDYNTYEELARQVTGFTPMELDLKKDFQFSGKEYAPRRSDAKTAANREILRADSTPADMISGWDNYLDTLYREQSKLYNSIQAARTLGLSDREIQINLVNKANLGSKEAGVIMRGEFYPGTASQEVLKDVMLQVREGRTRLTGVKDIPVRELMQLSKDRMLQPLAPELFRKRQAQYVDEAEPKPVPSQGGPLDDIFGGPDAAQGGPLGDLFSGASPAAPATGPMPAPVVPQATPATATARTAPPAPALLGGDPISQARNAEISQRLSGQ